MKKFLSLLILALSTLSLFAAAKKPLVLYYSQTNNTKTIADKITKLTNADEVEIQTLYNYPTDYDAVKDVVKIEIEEDILPPLKGQIDLSKYDVIFLGSPIWAGKISTPVQSFLCENDEDFEGKTIVPFITSGSGSNYPTKDTIYGYLDEDEVKVLTQFSVKGKGDKMTDSLLKKWISGLKLGF